MQQKKMHVLGRRLVIVSADVKFVYNTFYIDWFVVLLTIFCRTMLINAAYVLVRDALRWK